MNINDVGLQLSALLSEGKALTPAVAKMLRKHLGQKDFQVEQIGDGGVQITLDGQVIAGPFHSEEEVQAAIQELQSAAQRGYAPVTKGWINWGLLGAAGLSAAATLGAASGGSGDPSEVTGMIPLLLMTLTNLGNYVNFGTHGQDEE